MNTANPCYRASLLIGTVLQLATLDSQAITFALQEQGGLTGFVIGGGGSVVITPTGTDHWIVSVTDARIGNATAPTLNLAFIEPELVSGMTAYNNVQVLSVNPGIAVFDVISDEFSPYSMILANNTTSLIQGTDIEPISIRFNDIADNIPEPGIASLLGAGVVMLLFSRRRGR